jgi:hypothetical protein
MFNISSEPWLRLRRANVALYWQAPAPRYPVKR